MTMTDHETALAGGFDIVEAGRWVRPDNASIVRSDISPRYRATRDYGPQPWASFYTMREAVEWIGPVDRHDDDCIEYCDAPDCRHLHHCDYCADMPVEGDPTRNGAFR